MILSLFMSFARQHSVASILTLIIAVLFASLMVEKYQVGRLSRDLSLARAEGESLSLSNAALLASLKQQNAAISAMEEAALKKAALARKAMAAATSQVQKYRKQVQEIHGAMPIADECGQLKSLLRQFSQP